MSKEKECSLCKRLHSRYNGYGFGQLTHAHYTLYQRILGGYMMEALVMIDSNAIKGIVLDYMPAATEEEIKTIVQSITTETEIMVFNTIRQAARTVQYEAKY